MLISFRCLAYKNKKKENLAKAKSKVKSLAYAKIIPEKGPYASSQQNWYFQPHSSFSKIEAHTILSRYCSNPLMHAPFTQCLWTRTLKLTIFPLTFSETTRDNKNWIEEKIEIKFSFIHYHWSSIRFLHLLVCRKTHTQTHNWK